MGSLNGEVLNFTSDNPQKFTELKVRFSPKQEGTGDPSPTNICPITGYSSIDVYLNDKQSETGATKYTIEFPEEAGTVYGGYVDFVNSELVVEWDEYSQQDMPNNPNVFNDHGDGYYEIGFGGVNGLGGKNNSFCSIFPYGYNVSKKIEGYTLDYVLLGVAYRFHYLVHSDTELTGANAKQWLLDHGLLVARKRFTPKHYPLNISKTYRTLLGTNVVWTNGDTIEAEVKDYPHGTTTKTETGSVLNFNTYQQKQLTETKISFTPKQSGSGTPSPDNVREIVGKKSVSLWVSGDERARPLPKEYQQVEYLESTGTQYIDVTQNYAMYETVVVAAVTKTRTNNAMICGYSLWNDTNRNCVIQTSASVGVCRRVGTNAWTNDAYINIEEYDAMNRILRFEIFKDHALVADATTGEELSRNDIELSQLPTMPVYLFHGSSNSDNYVTRYISARIYSAIFYLNGETAYDLVPCYRKSDSVAGMYDLVSGTFYTNSGTGEFLVGEDIVGVETSVSFPSITKNLLDSTNIREGYYIDTTGKEIANNQFGYTTAYTPVEPNETYVLSGNIGNSSSAYGAIYCYDENKNFVNRLGGFKTTQVPHTFTVPSDTYYINVQIFIKGTVSNVQLEKGSTATAYEPFDNTIYGGYVDLASGEIWKTHIGYDIDSLAPGLGNPDSYDGETGIRFVRIVSKTNSIDASWGVICNILPTGKYNGSSQNKSVEWVTIGNSGTNNLFYGCVNTNRLTDTTITSIKDYLRENGFFIVLKLSQPELVATLPPAILTTLQGNNVMWSDGDELTISYTDDVVNTYDFRRHISLDTPHKASASGAVASFGTDMVGKMKCKIHFSPQQEGSGTPSPDNVREISGRSSVKLWQSGKNLFDKSNVVGGYINENGEVTGSSGSWAHQYIYVKGINKLTVSGSFSSTAARNVFFDADMNPINTGTAATTKVNRTITVPSGAVWYGCSSFINPNRFDRDIDTLQVEIGETATEYEPYTSNEITFTFPSTVGDNGVVYGGYLDTEKGELVAEWYSVPTSAWTTYRQNNGYICYRAETSHGTILGGTWLSNVISEYGSFSSSAMNKNIIQKNNSGGGAIYMALDENVDISTVQVVYQTSTPIHYSLTPQSIATLRGSNRIWSDGGSVEVEYYKHTDEPQEYIPAEVLGTGNIAIVTSDGYLIGEEQDYIKY